MPWCKDCGDFYLAWPLATAARRFTSRDNIGPGHTCPPQWIVWCPDHDETIDDGRKSWGLTPEDAIERWARDQDQQSCEYTIVNHGLDEVCCCPLDKQDDVSEGRCSPSRFAVDGEMIPHYHVRKIN